MHAKELDYVENILQVSAGPEVWTGVGNTLLFTTYIC